MNAGTLLVTGGLGYVGGRVIRALRRAAPGRDIRILTRRSPASQPVWARGLTVVQADLLVTPDLAPALHGVETVIHLAGPPQEEAKRDVPQAIADRVTGTARLIEAAHRARVGRILYLSTIHVYGRLDASPIGEDLPPRPLQPYAVTHLAAEQSVLAEGRSGRMGALAFRLSNGYGCPAEGLAPPWPTYAFLSFCQQAVLRGAIAIGDSGRGHRDFVWVEDVGQAVGLALDWPADLWGGDVYNLGGECSMPIREVADRIAAVARRHLGRPVEVRTGTPSAPDQDRPVRFRIDRLKARGFVPRHAWEAEIAATLDLCHRLPA